MTTSTFDRYHLTIEKFKREAVKLVGQSGPSKADIARNLGISWARIAINRICCVLGAIAVGRAGSHGKLYMPAPAVVQTGS